MNNDQRLNKTADLLKVLTNPTCLRIIRLLGQQGELNVTQIVKELAIEQSLTSRHLTKMRDKCMLASRRQGKQIWYSLADSALSQAVALAIG